MDDVVSAPVSARPIDALADEIATLAGHLNAADRRFLALLAEFDDREGWAGAGARSCAHWLNWKIGLDLGAAREKLRVAHALDGLPLIGAAMARGELSYSKVRALTRVASPETEPFLLSIALEGTAHHVEQVVRKFRRVVEAQELSREARQQETRSLNWRYDEDGSIVIQGRLPAEMGTLFVKAINEVVRQLRDAENVSAETSAAPTATFPQKRADALAALAESFLAHGLEALSGGERQQIVVHVDAATLHAHAPGCCELEDGPAIPVETARRLACDASVVKIVEDEDGNPLDIGRKTRSIPPALKRALNSRDQGCRFPGCTHRHFVDGHHIEHWAHGGATKLGNLVLLCRFHHRLVHEGGVRIEILDDGAFRFTLRDGKQLDSPSRSLMKLAARIGRGRADTAPSDRWSAVVTESREQAIVIDADTAVSRWGGERLDYSLAIQVLHERGQRALHDRPA